MLADDPRHGTTRGYHQGCHEACCRAAMARYEKAGRLARLNGGLAVPALGSQRRLQALMALGWSSHRIATEAGLQHRNHVWRIVNGQKGKPTIWIQRSTREWVSQVYEALSMRIPNGAYAERTRAHARRMGWAPPLAWDDIDHDEAPNLGQRGGPPSTEIDEAVILRVVNDGVRPRRLTPAEAAETYRRLRARGLTTTQIERQFGLNSERYKTEKQSGDAA